MVWICIGALSLFFFICFLYRDYKKDLFIRLSIKQHPLRFMYPACAKLTDKADAVFRKTPQKMSSRAKSLLKSLYVKENVETEVYIYRVQKCSVLFAVLAGVFLIMLFMEIPDKGPVKIVSLERPSYGSGTADYELEVSYRDNEEILSLSVDQVMLDESHILELFDESRDEVERIMLGDNSSCDEVSMPLDLITQYRGFDIWWDIGDTSLLNYNGEIKKEMEEGQSEVLNLFATFSMDNVSQIYNFPVCLVSPALSGKEELKKRIMQEIENNNDAYKRKVDLPAELDGERLSFFTVGKSNAVTVFMLGIIAAAAIWLLYDKKLEKSVERRQEMLMTDFSRIVSKLNLLYGAGLSVHGAFERIVEDHEKNAEKSGRKEQNDYAYLEMKLALEKIRNGESEAQAYAQFGKRCAMQPYIKLGNILERNISKGAKGMEDILKDEAQDAYEQRKRLARKKGEQAGTKMLVPMTLLMLVVIAIIAFPAMMSIKF